MEGRGIEQHSSPLPGRHAEADQRKKAENCKLGFLRTRKELCTNDKMGNSVTIHVH